jgi:hypothetical protein
MIKNICAYLDRNCNDLCMAYDIVESEDGSTEVVCRRLAAESFLAMNIGDFVTMMMPRDCECEECKAEKELEEKNKYNVDDSRRMFTDGSLLCDR